MFALSVLVTTLESSFVQVHWMTTTTWNRVCSHSRGDPSSRVTIQPSYIRLSYLHFIKLLALNQTNNTTHPRSLPQPNTSFSLCDAVPTAGRTWRLIMAGHFDQIQSHWQSTGLLTSYYFTNAFTIFSFLCFTKLAIHVRLCECYYFYSLLKFVHTWSQIRTSVITEI